MTRARLARRRARKQPSRSWRRRIFWISSSGKTQLIDLRALATEHKLGELRYRAPVERDRQIWLVADADAGTVLLAPVDAAEVTRAE